MATKETCVLIKQSELDSLKEPLIKARAEFQKELKVYEEQIASLREQLTAQNAPQLNPMKLELSIEFCCREGFPRSEAFPHDSYYRRIPQRLAISTVLKKHNIELDQPLAHQIYRIINMVQADIIAEGERQLKCNLKEAATNVEDAVLRKVARMNWLERKTLLNLYRQFP